MHIPLLLLLLVYMLHASYVIQRTCVQCTYMHIYNYGDRGIYCTKCMYVMHNAHVCKYDLCNIVSNARIHVSHILHIWSAHTDKTCERMFIESHTRHIACIYIRTCMCVWWWLDVKLVRLMSHENALYKVCSNEVPQKAMKQDVRV